MIRRFKQRLAQRRRAREARRFNRWLMIWALAFGDDPTHYTYRREGEK